MPIHEAPLCNIMILFQTNLMFSIISETDLQQNEKKWLDIIEFVTESLSLLRIRFFFIWHQID